MERLLALNKKRKKRLLAYLENVISVVSKIDSYSGQVLQPLEHSGYSSHLFSSPPSPSPSVEQFTANVIPNDGKYSGGLPSSHASTICRQSSFSLSERTSPAAIDSQVQIFSTTPKPL